MQLRVLTLMVIGAFALMASAASALIAELSLTVKTNNPRPRWGQTIVYTATVHNRSTSVVKGLTVEAVQTVDMRFVPIRASITPKVHFMGQSKSFWRLAVLDGLDTVRYQVTVRLPQMKGKHKYCFSINLYLLQDPNILRAAWSKSASSCAAIS